MAIASELLGTDVHDLIKVFTSRQLQVSGEWYDVPLTVEQAAASRDALAKVCRCGACTMWRRSRD